MSKKIYVLKIANTFIEPSCSYQTSDSICYSSSFLNVTGALSLNGYTAHSQEVQYPIGQFLNLKNRSSSNYLLKRKSIASLLKLELEYLKHSTAGSYLLDGLRQAEIIICMGGLFSDLVFTTAIYAISEFLAVEKQLPLLRIGNFASLSKFFKKHHSNNVDIHNLIDTDPIQPMLEWVDNQVLRECPHEAIMLPGMDNKKYRLSTDALKLIFKHHQQSIQRRSLSIFSNPKSLKQRILTIGFGCPQSCTFCPSRLSLVKNYESEFLFKIIQLFSKFSPNKNFYLDLLHADPLTKPETLLKLASLAIESNIKLNHIARIQTRLAFLKDNRFIDLFKALNIRLIYVGLETIENSLSRSLKKYNNNAQDFIAIAKEYKEHGIYLRGNFVIGLPGQTESQIRITQDFIQENPLLIGNICPFRPIPGTPDGDIYLERLGNILPPLEAGQFPDWYTKMDFSADAYSRIFMSRYDTSPDSPALQLIPSPMRTSFVKTFLSGEHLVRSSFETISELLFH